MTDGSTCQHEDDTFYEYLVESEYTEIEEPSDLEGWNEETEVLECTRETEEGEKLCVFHAEPEDGGDEISEKLATALGQETEVPLRIVDLQAQRLIMDDVTVERPVYLPGTKIEGRFELDNTEFGTLILQDAEFGDVTHIEGVTFTGSVDCSGAKVSGGAEIITTSFEEDAVFSDAKFTDEVLFDRVKFHGDAKFDYTTFTEEARFGSCRFADSTTFYGSAFEKESRFAKVRNLDESDGMVDAKTRFEEDVDFREATFHENSRFDVVFEDSADFRQGSLSNSDLRGADLTNANFENANLSSAILYDANLRGTRLMGAQLEDARLNNGTCFLGDPTADTHEGYDHSVTKIVGKKRCCYDPNADTDPNPTEEGGQTAEQLRNKARTVYSELEDLGKDTSHAQLQTRAFVRRKDMEREQYWEDIWSVASGPTQPLVAGARWLRAKTSRTIMLYGESPWRVFYWSVIAVVAFALSFVWFGLIQHDNGNVVHITPVEALHAPVGFIHALAGAVYYSALIFTNLSFGRYSPVGIGTYLTAIETTIGLTMLALFFFVLGRRASK